MVWQVMGMMTVEDTPKAHFMKVINNENVNDDDENMNMSIGWLVGWLAIAIAIIVLSSLAHYPIT